MKLVRVNTEEYYRYIPIKGLDSVEEALNILASGKPRGAHSAEHQLTQDLGETHGGEAVAYYFIASTKMGQADQGFVRQRIMNEARNILATRDLASFRFDYDGPGPFFKTSVDIQVLDRAQDLYALGLYAGYVGEKPEIGLAEALGIDRGLIWAAVNVETFPSDNMFEFSLLSALTPLGDFLGWEFWLDGAVSPIEIADSLLEQVGKGQMPSCTIYVKDDLLIKLVIKDVARPLDFSPGRARLTWSSEKGTIRGPLLRSYTDPDAYQAPLFSFFISTPLIGPSFHTNVMYLPDQKAKALGIRDIIATGFQGLITA